MSDRIYCLCGCGLPLTGKQRKFRSDACRKRHNRKPDTPESVNVRELAESGQPQSFSERFTDIVSGLDGRARLLLIQNLNSVANYQDTWTKRVLAQPSYFPPGALEAYQASEAIFRAVIDLVQGAQL